MSERDATALLDRLVERLPASIPPTEAIISGARARRRRRHRVRAAGSVVAVAAVVGLGALARPSDLASRVPAATDLPGQDVGTHWVGGGGALLAVPDDGTVQVTLRDFDGADSRAWSLPTSLPDGKPVDTVTRGPVCVGQGDLTTCRTRTAVPGLHLLVVVSATGERARSATREVLDTLTFVAPPPTLEQP